MAPQLSCAHVAVRRTHNCRAGHAAKRPPRTHTHTLCICSTFPALASLSALPDASMTSTLSPAHARRGTQRAANAKAAHGPAQGRVLSAGAPARPAHTTAHMAVQPPQDAPSCTRAAHAPTPTRAGYGWEGDVHVDVQVVASCEVDSRLRALCVQDTRRRVSGKRASAQHACVLHGRLPPQHKHLSSRCCCCCDAQHLCVRMCVRRPQPRTRQQHPHGTPWRSRRP
jgi:hypothetical protein